MPQKYHMEYDTSGRHPKKMLLSFDDKSFFPNICYLLNKLSTNWRSSSTILEKLEGNDGNILNHFKLISLLGVAVRRKQDYIWKNNMQHWVNNQA